MRTYQFILAVCVSTTFFACKQEDNPVVIAPLTAITVKSLAADPTTGVNPTTGQPIGTTGKFTFFSFKENRQIANTDSATNKWDVGFRGQVIINGGAIRTGQGGAYVHTGTFDELTTVPASATFSPNKARLNWQLWRFRARVGIPIIRPQILFHLFRVRCWLSELAMANT